MNEIRRAYETMLYAWNNPMHTDDSRHVIRAWVPFLTTWAGLDTERLEQLQGTMREFAIHKEVSGANN